MMSCEIHHRKIGCGKLLQHKNIGWWHKCRLRSVYYTCVFTITQVFHNENVVIMISYLKLWVEPTFLVIKHVCRYTCVMSFNVCRLYVILMWIIWFRSQSSKQRINELTNKLLINFKVNDKIDFTTTIVVSKWFCQSVIFW